MNVIGERIARGVAVFPAGQTGRNSRYMLSGLLKCSECGSNYVMVNTVRYACAGYVNGRICGNDRYVRRDTLEKALLADVEAGLLDPHVMDEIERRIRQATKSLAAPMIARHELLIWRPRSATWSQPSGQGMLSLPCDDGWKVRRQRCSD